MNDAKLRRDGDDFIDGGDLPPGFTRMRFRSVAKNRQSKGVPCSA